MGMVGCLCLFSYNLLINFYSPLALATIAEEPAGDGDYDAREEDTDNGEVGDIDTEGEEHGANAPARKGSKRGRGKSNKIPLSATPSGWDKSAHQNFWTKLRHIPCRTTPLEISPNGVDSAW